MIENTVQCPSAKSLPLLEPTTQDFIDGAAVCSAEIDERSVDRARAALVALQTRPTGKPYASVQAIVAPVGPKGFVRLQIIKPQKTRELSPALILLHGGGWALGDAITHDRLARELAVGIGAVAIIIEYSRTPESQFPIAVEEAYAATEYIEQNAISLGIDRSRIAIVGDGSGGNIAAAVTLLCRERRTKPNIRFQVLFYPITAASLDTDSYRTFEKGPWLTKRAMECYWAAYVPNKLDRRAIIASPLNATVDQLRGLPDALVVTAENDVLRDEGEAYARKLSEANVRVTCVRYLGTIHDFVMLNPIADAPAARSAIALATSTLRDVLV